MGIHELIHSTAMDYVHAREVEQIAELDWKGVG